MPATAIVILVVVVVLVAAAAAASLAVARRRRLRDRFGPEYDRAVSEHDSRREAEAELAQRERRVRELDIRPLSEPARARYARQWDQLQERFVDSPADTVAACQVLVTEVITARGYPADDRDQVLADLSVEHARTLGRYRDAEQVSLAAAAGRAATEELRQAIIQYRALFRELLGEPAGAEPAADEPVAAGRAASEPVMAGAADDSVAGEAAGNGPAVGGAVTDETGAREPDAGTDGAALDASDDDAVRVPPRREPRS